MIERGAGPTVVNLSKGASARVETERDHDTIGDPAWHICNASNVLCLFSLAHFSKIVFLVCHAGHPFGVRVWIPRAENSSWSVLTALSKNTSSKDAPSVVSAGCRAGNANHGLDPVVLPIYRNYPKLRQS